MAATVSRAQGPRSSGGAARPDDEQWQAPSKARPSCGVVAAAAAAALDAFGSGVIASRLESRRAVPQASDTSRWWG
jgi:hypothetical protein